MSVSVCCVWVVVVIVCVSVCVSVSRCVWSERNESECLCSDEHKYQDPKDGELCLRRAKSGKTLVE